MSEKFDIENFPTSDSGQRMLSYVSADFYENSYVGKWLFQIMGKEYDSIRTVIAEELVKQLWAETATWGLRYHEQKWHLPIRENLSYEERRQLIYQKRDYRAPMTPYKMETAIANYFGIEVRIVDVHDPGIYGWTAPHPNEFRVYFITGESLDGAKIKAWINKLKQSHTTYTMNQRIEVEVDQSLLEKMLLRQIVFYGKFDFWGGKVLDGTWYLDGSVLLGSGRYNMRIGLSWGTYKVRTTEMIDSENIALGILINEGNMARAGQRLGFGIDFWRRHYLDGTWYINGEKRLDSWFDGNRTSLLLKAKAKTKEEYGGVEVITHSRDYWFLTGEHSLDGSRMIDTIYRKEIVQ